MQSNHRCRMWWISLRNILRHCHACVTTSTPVYLLPYHTRHQPPFLLRPLPPGFLNHRTTVKTKLLFLHTVDQPDPRHPAFKKRSLLRPSCNQIVPLHSCHARVVLETETLPPSSAQVQDAEREFRGRGRDGGGSGAGPRSWFPVSSGVHLVYNGGNFILTVCLSKDSLSAGSIGEKWVMVSRKGWFICSRSFL